MPETKKKKRKTHPKLTAATADRHVLYGRSVQNVEAEIDFVDETFLDLRGRRATTLREDFCGTASSACEWVRRRTANRAVGVDLCSATLDWAREHNLSTLRPSQRDRVVLLHRDVTDPGPKGRGVDVTLAMNFSYWVFTQRSQMVAYFRSVRDTLAPGGLFILDHYGGSDALSETRERRKMDGFTYVWDQHKYNPITGEMVCYIHFEFPDGSKMKRAFEYHWRHWTLPEIRDCLADAGFVRNAVYWEGEDDDGEGNGEFEPTEEGEADLAFITYIVAER